MIDVDYLQKVVNALELHAQKHATMADLFGKAHELKGDTMYQDHATICLEYAKQLREHGEYIQEVIDEPHLLVKQ